MEKPVYVKWHNINSQAQQIDYNMDAWDYYNYDYGYDEALTSSSYQSDAYPMVAHDYHPVYHGLYNCLHLQIFIDIQYLKQCLL